MTLMIDAVEMIIVIDVEMIDEEIFAAAEIAMPEIIEAKWMTTEIDVIGTTIVTENVIVLDVRIFYYLKPRTCLMTHNFRFLDEDRDRSERRRSRSK